VSRRQWFRDAASTSQGLLYVDLSFLTNNTSNPVVTSFRGCGGLTGSNGATSVANSGPSAIASITRTAVGTYRITFAEGYRYITSQSTDIDDAADQLQARCGAPANEGAGATTPLTVDIFVRSAGTLTESTGRRISYSAAIKDSGNGT
jgi:hypothetical protein